MRKVALAIAAILVLGIVAPAFSQPFADVPTDHWAFDAIAELAAKGIVEGYPDGTFKGDRAMTRYEMAMVVARLLARIEAIKIPPPAPPVKIPAPEVTRRDIQTLQRLINEFRAELAALGVRVTAVEEELAALRARLDNTKISGDVRLRYTVTTSGSASADYRSRITLTGQAAPNVVAVARFFVGTFSFGTPAAFAGVTFDRAYLDVKNIFGFNWRVGRAYDILGPVGLLFDAGNTAIGVVDGLKVSGSVGGIGLSAFVYRNTTSLDLWGARAEFGLVPGWTFGAAAYSERPVPAGTASTGFSFDFAGGLVPGIDLSGEFMTWTPAGLASRSGWTVTANFNLARLAGATFAPSLAVGYKNYNMSGVTPLYSNAYDYWGNGATVGNFRGWNVQLGLKLTPKLSGTVVYESGNVISSGAAVTTLDAYADWSLASRTNLRFQYSRSTVGGTDTANRYRLTLTYSW